MRAKTYLLAAAGFHLLGAGFASAIGELGLVGLFALFGCVTYGIAMMY